MHKTNNQKKTLNTLDKKKIPMYDVITVGSATFDVFARTEFSEIVKIIDPKGETDLLAFPSGSKILIDEIDFSTGGSGTNTGVALSRLGHKVAFVGRLGQGTNSAFIHKQLQREKVDQLCAHGDGMVGYSIILDTLEHDRTILAYKGANDHLTYSGIPTRKLKTKWFYFGAMLHESFRTQEKLALFAKKCGIKIAFNPSTYLAKQGAAALKGILTHTELLVLNREEACLLAGSLPMEQAIRNLHSLGPNLVVVTDGKNRLFVSDGATLHSAMPPKIKVVDATGAGDAFAASFLSGLLRTGDIAFAIKLGIVNSSSVLSNYGAKNILLSYPEALRRIKKLRISIASKRL